jgi:fructuronate reductase
LTYRRLTRSTVEGVRLPDGGLGIVHLGLGAFHRAHQAVLTQRAMLAAGGDWSIAAVAPHSTKVRDALQPQDNLFTVATRAGGTEELEVVGSIREVLVATQQPGRLTALLSSPDIHVVTLTVTEAGYQPDGEIVAQLVRGLRARRAHDAGLTVISCDNLPDNGRLLSGLVSSACEPALSDWVSRRVTFPSSVVDQIVPATTGDDLRAVAAKLGLADFAAVVGEPHRQWVVEDRFGGPRPPWEHAGVVFTDDIGPYQRTKLRVVNGTHSALAYLGLRAGYSTTAEVAVVPEFVAYVKALVHNETGPGDADAVVARFANPMITHRLTQIADGGRHKLPQRLLAPAAELIAAGREPRLICLALAAYPGRLDFLPPALGESPVFRSLLADARARLDRDGVLETLRRL